MKPPKYNAMRVMGNGQIYNYKKIMKMVFKFKKMNWIEQQSVLIGLADNTKSPIDDFWTEKRSIRVTKSKKYTS